MNVPKLRFKEFTDEWKKVELDKLYEFKNGLNGDRSLYGKGVELINVSDILNNTYITSKVINGKININENTLRKNSVEYGDILFQRSSETFLEIGTSNVYLDNKLVTFSGFVIRGKRKKDNINNPLFINYVLKSPTLRKKIIICGSGAQHYNIGQEDLKRITIFLPSIKEQKKIADMLELLDKKIELQTKKIEALKLFKLCILKHIFSSATVKIKLKDVSNIVKGKQINSEELSKSGSYYMLNGGTEPSGYLEKYNTLENTITISEGGNSCGYVKYNKYKFWCGGHCYSIKNKLIDNHYLYQLLKFNEKKIMRLRIGSGLPNIQKKDLENFELFIHEKDNQYKIANLLMKYDTKIELEKNKLDKLALLKTGLLQNMFI